MISLALARLLGHPAARLPRAPLESVVWFPGTLAFNMRRTAGEIEERNLERIEAQYDADRCVLVLANSDGDGVLVDVGAAQ